MKNYDNDRFIKITDNHVIFYNDKILTNFSSCTFWVDDQIFNSSEQYFMYQKAIHFKDHETAKLILKATNPAEAKRLGRQVKNYNDKSWNAIRDFVMCHGLYNKFTQSKPHKEYLMRDEFYGKLFVEASPIDRIWGVGMDIDNPDIDDESKWLGENALGQLLTSIRNLLRVRASNY